MKQPALGKRITELRKEKGLTQEELVNQCNINVRTIQRIEAGEVTPRSFTIKSILDVLGVENKMFFKELEKSTNYLSKQESSILTTSWIFGIFFFSFNIVLILMEFAFFESNSNYTENLYFKIPFGILFLMTLIMFLRGYKLLGEKNENAFLVNSVYAYVVISFLIILINIMIEPFSFDPILGGILMMILLGLSEILIGFGILKLQNSLDDFPKIVGIIKISNGFVFLTVILSPLAWFLVFPITILEIFFLHNISKIKK